MDGTSLFMGILLGFFIETIAIVALAITMQKPKA